MVALSPDDSFHFEVPRCDFGVMFPVHYFTNSPKPMTTIRYSFSVLQKNKCWFLEVPKPQWWPFFKGKISLIWEKFQDRMRAGTTWHRAAQFSQRQCGDTSASGREKAKLDEDKREMGMNYDSNLNREKSEERWELILFQMAKLNVHVAVKRN